jgi:hypothetical protein
VFKVNFISCPICSGHEQISADAADALADLIGQRSNAGMHSSVQTELENIRNTILNMEERRPKRTKKSAIDPLLL